MSTPSSGRALRFLGHPIHAVVVAFPIALLTLAPVWDLLALLGFRAASSAGYLGEIAGLVAGVLAVVTGCIDFVRARKSAAVESLGLWHGSAAVTGLSIFAVALALRAKDHHAPLSAIALEVAGAACLAVTGWCGGHLVFHHGVAVRSPSDSTEQPVARYCSKQ